MRRIGVTLAGCAVLLAGCSGGSDDAEFPLDEMPVQSEPSPDPTADDLADAGGGDAELPQECSGIISFSDVATAVGAPLTGGARSIFADGGFSAESGRLQQLTCRYGGDQDQIGGEDEEEADDAPPLLELRIATYVDAERAAGRIPMAVADTTGEVESADIAGVEGFFITHDDRVTYLAADGVRTYVLTLQRGVVGDAAERVVLIAIAEHLLGRPEPTPTD
jgi:hypothetical protein